MRCNTVLTEEENTRYNRQIRLPEVGKEGQEKLKGSSVLVVGAGALGCPVLQYLTAAGIGKIGVVDNDWVDVTNLQRQVIYTIEDISKPKPLAAKENLKLLNPAVEIKMHYLRLDKETAITIIPEYDIIVDCSDNFATRYLINDAAVILNKPFVYGAIHKFSGQIMVLNFENGPTLRCIYPEAPHPLEVPSCDDLGVLGTIAGIIGSMQANEVIKMILGKGEVLNGKLFTIDSLNFRTQIVSFERNPAASNITKLGDYDDGCFSGNEFSDEISVNELKQMHSKNPDLLIVNLQEDQEDLIPVTGIDTISIPYYKIAENINLLLNRNCIVFYCNNGIKSMQVKNYLQKAHNMKNLYCLNSKQPVILNRKE
jgi:sulfur-carrier protein adenylyltransferase/sulfurtransferase